MYEHFGEFALHEQCVTHFKTKAKTQKTKECIRCLQQEISFKTKFTLKTQEYTGLILTKIDKINLEHKNLFSLEFLPRTLA